MDGDEEEEGARHGEEEGEAKDGVGVDMITGDAVVALEGEGETLETQIDDRKDALDEMHLHPRLEEVD